MSELDDTNGVRFETRGPGHKRTGHPRLSSHTPVRFDPETIAAIRRFSDEDGLTVSAWVRRVVGREIRRSITLLARTGSRRNSGVTVSISQSEGPTTTSTSVMPFISDLRAVS